MISRPTIQRIFDTAIIEEVVGEFVRLKKSGTSWKGLSPFANERTPSFFVVPHKGIYKDFSSGKGGNVVDFLMEHEKLSYPEAMRWLAAKYNIEIEEDAPSEEQLKERSEREQLSVVTDFAHKYFQEQLHESEEGKAIGLAYFQERGFRDDIIKKFQLGYSHDKWDAMTQAALEGQYSLEYLKKVGLTRERDGVSYDFFRGRVMFPIHNIGGKVIAFGGRTLKAEKDIAKYFNSPESELYNKSSVLYGLHLAKNAIVKSDMCYLVEGYTDVIALHQAGVENVVASSGTSLTEGQIRLIRRYTPNITILYDADAAGIKASFRGIDMILKEGMNVRVLLFPDGDDPDSFSRKHSSTEVQEFLEKNTRDFIAFKTSLLLDEVGNDPVKRAELIRGIVESIALIPDAIKRSVYTQECSRLMNMGEQVLITELNKVIRSNFKRQSNEQLPVLDEIPADGIPNTEIAEPEFTLYHQEKDLIRLLLAYGEKQIEIPVVNEEGAEEKVAVSVAEFLIGSIQHDEIVLETTVYSRIFSEYVEFISKTEFPEARYFTLHNDPEISTSTTDLVTSPYHLSENWTHHHSIYPETEDMQLRKAAKDCIYRLKLRKVMSMIRDIEKELEEHHKDEEKSDHLQQEKMMLDKAKVELAKYFGTVVV
ncbi:MAG: DNA primase [Flavobacteriales bacterium]|nr:DNA primase [Flavobacteriales bacterium]